MYRNEEACEAKAESDKRKRYEKLAADKKAHIVPFYLSPFGAWGNEATQFVKLICKANEEELTGISTNELRYSICASIAVAIQRGNARALTACVDTAIAAAAAPEFHVIVPDEQPLMSFGVSE